MGNIVSISAEVENGHMEYRRIKRRAAWMKVENRTGVYTASLAAGHEMAVRNIAMRDAQAHMRVFRAGVLEILIKLGITDADEIVPYTDTGVCRALWHIEGGNLIVDAEPPYEVELTMGVAADTKNEDAAYILLRSIEAARMQALEARYRLLMRDVLGGNEGGQFLLFHA